jgi:hypothetical protein
MNKMFVIVQIRFSIKKVVKASEMCQIPELDVDYFKPKGGD